MKLSELPKLSIVTPNLNAADTLAETIESIVTQDYPRLEYIIVDGGSTDGSLEIVNSYALSVDNLLAGKDRNLYDAVAKGFEAARGEVLGWLNSDDCYEPGSLQRVGEAFARNPDWQVVYFDGSVLKCGWRLQNRPQKIIGLPELLRGHILYQDCVFFRRSAYEAVGGLDRVRYRLAGDYDLWLRLAARYDFHYLPSTASCFRIRPGQLSGQWGKYLAEMETARALAQERDGSNPRLTQGSEEARRNKATLRIDASRRFHYPLDNENLLWPDRKEPKRRPQRECRCPLCGGPPERMLFSATDTWYGDERSWPVYHCAGCEHAFLFPPPAADEFHELNYREACADEFRVRQPEQGLYRVFARPTAIDGSAFYRTVDSRIPRWWKEAADLCRVREAANARILEVGGGRGRMLDALSARGFRDLTSIESHGPHADRLESLGYRVLRGAVTEIVFDPGEYDAAVFHLSLAYLHNPVNALRHVARGVRKGGSVYISTPNLDSVWLERYGPVWSPWHAPYHLSTYSRKSLRILAEKAGLAVDSLRTNSPAHWLAMSDRLAPLGAAGAVPPHVVLEDAELMRLARAASFTSAVRYDWRGRGDCLHARLRVG